MLRVSLDAQSPAEALAALSLSASLQKDVENANYSPMFESSQNKQESLLDKYMEKEFQSSFTSVQRSSLSNKTEDYDLPDMWSKHYIGLYSQYAAIGLLYGTSGALTALCVYVYDGSPNLCANSQNITFFAWSFKIVFAVITDTYRPFGLRRKPWMLFGWGGVLIILLTLAIVADKLSASTWVVMLMLVQFFAMFSDVPADGYSVELGQLEPPHKRGVILATGQMIRFIFCIIAGAIQALLLNGPSTNDSGCQISFDNCWSWGLTINQYYALLFVLTFILTIPIIYLKETDPSTIPRYSFSHFVHEIWLTLKNLTTFYLLIFVIGSKALTNFTSIANLYMQYYVIQLTNFEAGIDTISTYAAVSSAIYVFKTFLINKNWRYTQYGATIISSTMGFIWILVYYNVGNLQDPWFTIFIDLDQNFVSGLIQVLFSLAVIELSKPGLEATTYELIITVANAAATVGYIIATQLLTPLKASACTSDDDTINCSSNTVDVNNQSDFNQTDGPYRFTTYCLTLTTISVVCCLIFTSFLPKDKAQCHEWKYQGDQAGDSTFRGILASSLCSLTIGYGFTVAVLLLLPSTSCLAVVGGSGC